MEMAAGARRVFVGLSGGVDSAVSAYLLKRQGFRVAGVFMRNWDERDETGVCESDREWRKVQNIGEALRIPVEKVDFVKEYWNNVFAALVDGYKLGRTPNPDVLCNEHIKFGALYDRFVGADAGALLATGHYCGATARGELLRGRDPDKDQSYFLCKTPRARLRSVLFPLAGMHKRDVKRIAAEVPGLAALARQPESMGICFVGRRRRFDDFLHGYIPARRGLFRSLADPTVILGEHRGAFLYTVGQKARIGGLAAKWYVARKDAAANDVFVVPSGSDPALHFGRLVVAFPPHFAVRDGAVYAAQVRHLQPPSPAACRVLPAGSGTETHLLCELTFAPDAKVRGAALGQYVALYNGETNTVCVAGGEIVEAYN